VCFPLYRYHSNLPPPGAEYVQRQGCYSVIRQRSNRQRTALDNAIKRTSTPARNSGGGDEKGG